MVTHLSLMAQEIERSSFLNSNVLVVPVNKISLFPKDLITFAISFILLFVKVSPEPLNNVAGFISILSLTRLHPAFKRAFYNPWNF